MATATTPAKPRKQLADQLDRLDGIIDLLADGLPAAVADATRAGTRQALVELLADPEVIGRFKAALTPDAPDRSDLVELKTIPKQSSPFARLKATAVNAVALAVRIVTGGIATSVRSLRAAATAASSRVRAAVLRRFRVDVPVVRYAAAALAVGTLLCVLGYAVPHEIAAALGGLGAAAVTMAVLIGQRIRRSLRTRTFAPRLERASSPSR